MKIDNYRFKCKTCKTELTKATLTGHIVSNPEHKIMVLEKPKAFMLSVLLSASISAIVFAILMKFMLEPQVMRLVEICNGVFQPI